MNKPKKAVAVKEVAVKEQSEFQKNNAKLPLEVSVLEAMSGKSDFLVYLNTDRHNLVLLDEDTGERWRVPKESYDCQYSNTEKLSFYSQTVGFVRERTKLEKLNDGSNNYKPVQMRTRKGAAIFGGNMFTDKSNYMEA